MFELVNPKRCYARRPAYRLSANLTGKSVTHLNDTYLQIISKNGVELWVKENELTRCGNPLVYKKK